MRCGGAIIIQRPFCNELELRKIEKLGESANCKFGEFGILEIWKFGNSELRSFVGAALSE